MAKNYKRRQILKYAASTAVGATVRGTIGGILGTAYDYTLRPLIDWAYEAKEHPIETTRKRFGIRYGSDDAIEEARKEEQMSAPRTRRGFLQDITRAFTGFAHKHPTETGVAVGVGYSAAKGAIGYRNARKKEEHVEKLEGEVNTLKKRVAELEGNHEENPGRTRKKDGIYGSHLDMAIFGLALISGIFIMYLTGNLTGYSILGTTTALTALIPAVIAGMVIFVFSIVYILTRD